MGRKNPGKGAQFERATCQRLSLWVSNLTRDDCFWRSAMSGGRATMRSKRFTTDGGAKRRNSQHFRECRLEAQAGDIVATHDLGNLLTSLFVLECKHYSDLHMDYLVWGFAGEITGWWEKTLKLARDTGREPLLVLRQNRRHDVIGTTRAGLDILEVGGRLTRYAYFPLLKMYVCSFREMITEIDFREIRRKHRER